MPEELEQQGTPLEDPEPEETEAAPQAATESDDADSDAGDPPKPQGDLNKALRAERETTKQLKEKNKNLEAIAQSYNVIAPYLKDPRVINAFQQATGMVAAGQPSTATDDPEVSAFVEEINAANQAGPDGVKRFAKSLLSRVAQVARAEATRAAEPAVRGTVASRAQGLLERAYQVRDPENPNRLYAKKEVIEQVARRFPEGVLARPEAIADILDMARGRGGPGPDLPSPYGPPLYTEAPGYRPTNKKEPLSALDRSIMQELGKNEKDYRALRDGIEITDAGAVLE